MALHVEKNFKFHYLYSYTLSKTKSYKLTELSVTEKRSRSFIVVKN